ncbi:glycosyltransferase [Candidatus Nanosalina sp. VS9-1]|uniref:glycosyltransferase n=1 Tax=Candidatus Nanosalina sp. VS9-1 TaxID=3388566 RepID=UPI0039E0B6AC
MKRIDKRHLNEFQDMRIAVVYPRISRGIGGIESVTDEILSELSEEDDVVFFSVVPEKFRESLSEEVLGRIEVRDVGSNIRIPLRDSERFQLLKEKLIHRRIGSFMEEESGDFDAVVFSAKFMYSGNFDCPTIQYVHNPSVSFQRSEYSSNPLKSVYDSFLNFLSSDVFDADLNLFNSEFTRETYSSISGDVLYPPVESDFFPGDKEDRVICLGRIARNKRIDEAIDIVASTEKNLEMTVMGRTTEGTPESYLQKLESREKKYDWLEIKTDVPQDELVKEMAKSKIGILSTRNEHFGIAAVEYMKAGALPMVHSSGGVQSLVNKDRFTYESIGEASEKIDENLGEYDELRDFVIERGKDFDVESFRKGIRESVNGIT